MKHVEAAICKALEGAPGEIQIIPFGRHETGKGAFVLDTEGMSAIIADFDSHDNDMVIDYEHQSLGGGEAPAAGWIKKLYAVFPDGPGGDEDPPRPAGLWATVQWTDRAKEYFRNREYRYLSPVFLKATESGRVVRLLNAALTNTPAIDGMVPLVNRTGGNVPPEHFPPPMRGGSTAPPAYLPSSTRRGDYVPSAYPPHTPHTGDHVSPSHTPSTPRTGDHVPLAPPPETPRTGYHVPPEYPLEGRDGQINKKEEKAMLNKLIKLLSLGEDTGEGLALEAVRAMAAEAREAAAMKEALGLEAGAGLSEATGTIEAMKQGHAMAGELGARLAALEAALKEKEAGELVAHAMGKGKVTPAQRDWALAYAGRDPEGFRTFVARSPVLVPMGEVAGGTTATVGLHVSELQLSVNRALGVDEETFRKHNRKQKDTA